MPERRVVVTGAGSTPGQMLIRDMAATPGTAVLAVLSPRRGAGDALYQAPGVDYLACDLSAPLPDRLRQELSSADAVVHLAWRRGTDAEAALADNRRMIENLLQGCPHPDRFLFVSTIAAGAGAPSVYGRTKFLMETLVRERGGSVLVSGLLESAELGSAYGKIEGLVAKTPFAFDFRPGDYRFYPVGAAALLARMRPFWQTHAAPGVYAGYPEPPLTPRAFFEGLEARHPRRRLPLVVPTGLLIRILVAARALRIAPAGTAERLLTLLYRDIGRLSRLAQPPGGAAGPELGV